MKIIVTGDTHGRLKKISEILLKTESVDKIIHCGDFYDDGKKIQELTGIPVVGVRGNCDDYQGPETAVLDTPAGRIIAVHGNHYGCDPLRLSYLAEENNAAMVCYGHTHMALKTNCGGITVLNPGSLELPRDGSGGTYAIVIATEDGFTANIVKYSTVCGTSEKTETKKGKLRDMLNYSDGF